MSYSRHPAHVTAEIKPMISKDLGFFIFIVVAIVVGEAWHLAFLTSFQQAGLNQLQTVWTNAAVLMGAVLTWYVLYKNVKMFNFM